jgi:glycerol-3-phosphate dehydrogenase
MWQGNWRERVWASLDQKWDLVVVGGGITGGGILRESARAGLKAVLFEANDFASGTSSRSSKLVHGGFRYLKNMQLKVMLQSVRERERLLREGRGLINPLSFLLVNYEKDSIPAWVFGAGLILYDLLAMKWGHRHYDHLDMHDLCPPLSENGLLGGFRYFDAQTDDARLVLRVIQEAVDQGALALNYARVLDLLRTRDGRVRGVVVQDLSPEGELRTTEIQSTVVVNATGAWADQLRTSIGGKERLRKLRGSHLIFALQRVLLSRSISFLHPRDHRPVFAFPWEGVTIFGTTDVDFDGPLESDTSISELEFEYLLEAAQTAFSCLELTADDVQGTYSGVRPVVDTGKIDPSKESREHILWYENGLVTVTGGKLTTFRLMAHDALEKVRPFLPGKPIFDQNARVLNAAPAELPGAEALNPAQRLRLLGRYGRYAPDLIAAARPDELQSFGGSTVLLAELRWAARSEAVIHLDDLLLRRARLGLLLPHGGMDSLEQIRSLAQPELDWDDERWDRESFRYSQLWKRCYYLSACTTPPSSQLI